MDDLYQSIGVLTVDLKDSLHAREVAAVLLLVQHAGHGSLAILGHARGHDGPPRPTARALRGVGVHSILFTAA